MPLKLTTLSGFGAAQSSPPAASPILDGKTAPLVAYSTRILLTSWVGNAVIRLRRGSDSVEDDFFGDLDGTLVNGSAQTPEVWSSASTLYIRTWYDQSGNGWNMNQGTAGTQPRLEAPGSNNFSQGYAMRNIINSTELNAGNVTGIGGAAGLTVLMMLSNVTLDTNDSHFSKHAGGSSGSFHVGSQTTSTGQYDCLLINSSSSRKEFGVNYSTGPVIANQPHMCEFIYNGSTLQGYINTTSFGSVGQTGVIKTHTANLLLGGLHGFANYRTNAHYAETICWTSALGDTEREEIRDAMSVFWD